MLPNVLSILKTGAESDDGVPSSWSRSKDWGLCKVPKTSSIEPLTPSIDSLGLISTFAPIGMLDLGSTLALTLSVKWA